MLDLIEAQKEFESVFKDSTNPHFKSKYASLDEVIAAVKPALNRNKFFLTQDTKPTERGVTIKTVFIHESGQTFQGGELFMPVSKEDAQGYGSALTYGRRYSLLTACGIAPEDDDGQGAVASIDIDWFKNKLVPMAIFMAKQGSYITASGAEEPYDAEQAAKLLSAYVSKIVSKEKIKEKYNNNGVEL